MNSRYSRISAGLLLAVTLSACFDKNVETRVKSARGKETITYVDDIKEYGDYDPRRDVAWKQSYMERIELNRKERRRQQSVDMQMKDGTLLDKYAAPQPQSKH